LYNQLTLGRRKIVSVLTISTVENKKELMDFISFPWKVYEQDQYWVPPLVSERKSFHDPKKNPFFEHAKVEYFIARRNYEVVGTIAAFTNDNYNQFQETNVGFFGFFEVLEDREAAEALLSTALKWVREEGHDSMIGPAQFSGNEELGLLIDGFDDRPRILMTYNPPRYQEYIEGAGFEKAMDLWAYSVDLQNYLENMPEKLIRVTEKVRERKKFVVRKVNMRDFDREVERLKPIYNTSWEKNWGFVPMTEPEFNKLGKDLKPFIDPEVVILVEQEGETIGFGLSVPDLCQPLRLAYPSPKVNETFTMAKLVWHWKVRRQVDWLRVIALGVLPEHRGTGVDALMYIETAKAAVKRGYKWAEMSWILENNEMMNRSIQMLGGKVYKTYRMFEKKT
jgi:GNAT superfamily N-acetyltransferase